MITEFAVMSWKSLQIVEVLNFEKFQQTNVLFGFSKSSDFYLTSIKSSSNNFKRDFQQFWNTLQTFLGTISENV